MRTLRLAVITAASTMALAGIGASPALAGSYIVHACSPGASPGAWQSVNTAGAGLTVGNACGHGTPTIGPSPVVGITDTGALWSEDALGGPSVPDGRTAGWEFSAPAGTRITRVSYYASWETDGGGWESGMWIDGAPAASNCRTNNVEQAPCSVINEQAPQVLSGLEAGALVFGVGCRHVQGTSTCTPNPYAPHGVEADLYSADVTLTETTAPRLAGEGGALWTAGTVVSGTVPLGYEASDPTGIREVRVLDAAGQTIASQTSPCDYAQPVPCPSFYRPAFIDVNTAALTDGAQHVELAVTNAAGVTTTQTGPEVTVDNNGPPPPRSLTATATGDTITLAWSNPASPEPIAAAYAQLCASSCQPAVPVSTGGSGQLTAPGPGHDTVRVWLTDTAGKGSSSRAASVAVTIPAPHGSPSPGMPLCCAPHPRPTSHCRCTCAAFWVSHVSWRQHHLHLKIRSLPAGDHLRITMTYKHHHHRRVINARTAHYRQHAAHRQLITIATRRPAKLVLDAFRGRRRVRGTCTITKIPLGHERPAFRVAHVGWRHHRLHLTIRALPAGDHLKITVTAGSHAGRGMHHRTRKLVVNAPRAHYRPHTIHRQRVTIRTARPTRLFLQAFRGRRRIGGSRVITHISFAKPPHNP